MDKAIHVALYSRKSREEETEDTLNRQISVLIEICKRNNWTYDLYKEVGSSQDLDRPKLQAMLDKVKLFHYDGIVVADLDRLSRNTGHFGTIKEILINFNCFVQIPGKFYDFSIQEDDLFSDIQSVLAKNEYQTIKKRLVRGTRQSAKDGNWMGKKVPIGYKYNRDTKRLELSDDAPVIQRIFQEYVDGLSTTDIADKFNLEGVTTTVGMLWSGSGISRLLNNPVYKGDSLFGKTRNFQGKRAVKTAIEDQILIKGTHDAIIDAEMWDKVQEIKRNRNSRPLVTKLGKHKFSGLIQCGICGRVHSFQNSRGKRKRITSCLTRHYSDNNFDKYTMCPNTGANVEDFEKLFFIRLSKYADKLEKQIEIIKKSEKVNDKSSEDKLSGYERQLKKIDQEIKRVQNGYRMEIFTEDEAQSQIKTLRMNKQNIENEIFRLQEEENNSGTDYLEKVLTRIKDILNGHNIMPERETNEKLREFINTIIYKKVGGQNAEIEMKIIWKQ